MSIERKVKLFKGKDGDILGGNVEYRTSLGKKVGITFNFHKEYDFNGISDEDETSYLSIDVKAKNLILSKELMSKQIVVGQTLIPIARRNDLDIRGWGHTNFQECLEDSTLFDCFQDTQYKDLIPFLKNAQRDIHDRIINEQEKKMSLHSFNNRSR